MRSRPSLAPGLLARLVARQARLISARALQQETLRSLQGLDRTAVAEVGRRVFEERLRACVRPVARAEIARWVAAGYEPVLATAAFDFLAQPIAVELGVREVVATALAYSGGVCLGRTIEPEPRGVAKAEAVRSRFASRTVDWSGSCAFSDEWDDWPLLELTGEPVFVNRRAFRPARLPREVRVVDWDAAQ